MVVRVSRSHGEDLVLKQVREQLNVAEPWFCSVERIWREVDVLRQCERLVRCGRTNAPFGVEVPRLLFEDRESYLYAMSAAPADHAVWKNELLTGVARRDIASSCGTLLGALHGGSWHDAVLARRLDDRQFFDDLRLDPYYRQIARVHGDLELAMKRLIDSVWSERHCLVHGDFSPKNLLVHGNRLMLIDFEVGHYGDPAFDLGFFLSHLVLKAFYHAPRQAPFFDLIDSFWSSYDEAMARVISSNELDALIGRSILNFAGCALARLDGKSKIDYLNDGCRRDAMRELCRRVFTEPPKRWTDVRQLACRLLAENELNDERY
ncbi:MAG: phosphotransferase [Planctomycetes bacterium]|nr:phosphotransferase [Planctomycetota bacterium]